MSPLYLTQKISGNWVLEWIYTYWKSHIQLVVEPVLESWSHLLFACIFPHWSIFIRKVMNYSSLCVCVCVCVCVWMHAHMLSCTWLFATPWTITHQAPLSVGFPRKEYWRGRWEGVSGWGIHVNLWLIHVNVWQKPLEYCKVINLQLIKINGKKITK